MLWTWHGVTLGGGLIGTVAMAATFLSCESPARFLVLDDACGPVDAAVVLAGDPNYERTATAAAIVLRGEARLLIVTGGEPGPGDSAASLRQRAISLGVPADRIRLEATSASTRQGVVAVAPILQAEGVHTVALVTSPYHQRRAFLAARRAWPGISICNRPASPSFWSPRGWWKEARTRGPVISEYIKIVYYSQLGWL